MKNLIEFIEDKTINDTSSLFSSFHNGIIDDKSSFNITLSKYLNSTMDEVRLWHASRFNKLLLKAYQYSDLLYIQNGVLRRELSGDISYPLQRDHSAHTLSNYIIGWLIFSHNLKLQDSFKKHFLSRCFQIGKGSIEEVTHCFGMLWPLVSLLHDIGYIFEGTINPLSTSLQNKQIKIGAEVLNDYFNHFFWSSYDADTVDEKVILGRLAQVTPISINTGSMAEISNLLRSLGDLSRINEKIFSQFSNSKTEDEKPDFLNFIDAGIPKDAFNLWETNYLSFNNQEMATRINITKQTFLSIMNHGLGRSGLRILDHGVCSGLILLLNTTFFYRLFLGLDNKPPGDISERKVWEKFRKSISNTNIKHDILFWWKGTVWASAAVAMHNILQMSINTQIDLPSDISPLKCDDDPLTYLGILVDIIQEWDRPTLSKESVINGILPLQGIDISVEMTLAGQLKLKLKNTKIRKRIINNLDGSLSEWDNYILIE